MADEIRFYRTQDDFGAFSNFAAYPIELDGVRWPTSEHYFQAAKFHGEEHREAIRIQASPTVAARMGRSRQRPLRKDWETVKNDVMRKAVRAKFTQHDELTQLLLSTGDALIIEHTRRDSYWGDGGHGNGQNWLGRILMEIRAELRDEQASDEQQSPSSDPEG